MLIKTQFGVTNLIRMPHQFFRTTMVSITFYDRSINVLHNPWQKHLKRNQIMEKSQFSAKKYSNNSINNTTK